MSIKTKSDAQNALREDWNCAFITQNLENIGSLKKLGTLLSKMRADVYNYHVGEHHNHFSDWIRDCFGDYVLSEEIRSLPKTKAAKAIKKRVKFLEKKAK